MENLIEKSKFKSFDLVVLSKCKWLNPLERDIDKDGVMSLSLLSHIVAGDDKDLLGRMEETYCTIDKANRGEAVHVIDNNQRYAVSITELLWGRMCAIAYYFYHEHHIWKDLGVFNKMTSMIKVVSVSRAVNDCVAIIDKKYKEEKEFQQKLATQTTPKPINYEYSPDIMRAMLDINNGSKKIYEIDWRKEFEHIGNFWNLMPEKTPIIIWLWGLLSLVKNSSKRLEVLKALKDARLSYPGTSQDSSDLFVAITALTNLTQKIIDYETNPQRKYIKSPWPLEESQLNGLAYILSDDIVTGRELVSLADQIFLYEVKTRTKTILPPILETYFYNGAYIHREIIKFISYLCKAEAYRQQYLSGNIELGKLPEDIKINRKLRNQCFDIFIEKRLKNIKEQFDKDESLVVDPSDLECFQRLMDEEKEAVKNAKEKSGSLYPGREIVLKMADTYLAYLKVEFEKLKKMSEYQDLMEAKTVNLAMGDNVLNKFTK